MDGVPELKKISLRYPSTCNKCGDALPARSEAWWDATAKRAFCPADAQNASADVSTKEALVVAPAIQPPTDAHEAIRGEAGASAQREWERRSQKRSERVLTNHPHLGRLLLALVDDPQSTRAWKTGAEGERILAERLARLADHGAVLLHDRRIPGSRANIDHIAVTPAGVWVIDAKRYKGNVAKRDVGGWFRTDERLYVGSRDRTSLVEGMRKQMDIVGAAFGEADVRPKISGALCFVGAEWSLFARPFTLNQVTIAWPKALVELLEEGGTLSETEVRGLGGSLAAHFPPGA